MLFERGVLCYVLVSCMYFTDYDQRSDILILQVIVTVSALNKTPVYWVGLKWDVKFLTSGINLVLVHMFLLAPSDGL